MAKRAIEEEGDCDATSHVNKRVKPLRPDHLSRLSDELLLKVLSLLPVSQLVVCQRLSHKYHKLAGDGVLWKSLYYDRFVKPRANRIPGSNDSVRTSRWLEDDALAAKSKKTHWKRQYKLKHNWSRGSAAVEEITVADVPAIPPALVQMQNGTGTIYTADRMDGLRAWAKGTKQMLARIAFPPASRPPISLAIDTNHVDGDPTKTIVGFEDGSYHVYQLSENDHWNFKLLYRSDKSGSNGIVSAVAMAWPYAVTMTATQQLSLYCFDEPADERAGFEPPRLLHSLKSSTVWPPLSTSLRTTPTAIFISIAYTLPTYLSGWQVGVQEVKVTPEGKVLDSRLASAIDQHYRPLAFSSRPVIHHLAPFTAGPSTAPALELRHIHSRPTSLSYNHPYLLVSLPDNTLTLYLVKSTADSLSIGPGSRLWGHTSAVSGAHVGNRGKAVSVSRRGDELRVWELEGGFASSSARKRLASGDLSIRIQPDKSSGLHRSMNRSDVHAACSVLSHRSSGSCALESAVEDTTELTLTRGWIGFDDESVVVLQERSQGKQALVVYDFT